jgi:hypothetical protein
MTEIQTGWNEGNAKHTQGPLVVKKAGTCAYYIESTNGKGRIARIEILNMPTEAEDEANASRLVACWNACLSIDTETIERLAGDDFIEHLISLNELLTSQRNDLLETLANIVCHENITNKYRLDAAETAIAKVIGKGE